MDNGLIFPYPRRSAPDGAGDADRPSHGGTSVLLVGSAGPDPVVVKRWGDTGR